MLETLDSENLPDSSQVVSWSLHNNSLTSIAIVPWSCYAKKLMQLYLDHNELTSLPSSFCSLTSLKELTLHDNRLRALPSDFGKLSELSSLRLDRNRLECLPNSICCLSELKILHI